MSEEQNKVEMAAVGGMLLDPNRAVPVARDRMRLKAEAWMLRPCQIIVAAIYEMMVKKMAVDTVTLSNYLAQQGTLKEAGELIFLNACMDACVVETHADYYLDLVRQEFIKMRIAQICTKISGKTAGEGRGDEMLKQIPAEFAEIIDEAVQDRTNKEIMGELYADWLLAKEGGERKKGLTTPWPSLDQYIGPTEAGLIVLAGRPSQGKTTIEGCISIYAAEHGKIVGRIGLDMTDKMILARNVCYKAGVSLPKLYYGHAGESNLEQVREAIKEIELLPFYINTADRDLKAICSWARMMKARHGLDLLTIDYIQQIQVREANRRWNENSEITFIMQVLKGLAFELQIPIIILSQLSREVEKNEREPRLSDLRGSGSLEQDATVVIFSYKDETEATTKETKQRRPMWVDVAKNQNGETGRIPMWFLPHYFRFEETEEGFPV